MAKKDCTGRLSFEKDFFKASTLSTSQDLVFALTNTKNVVITSRFNFNYLNNREIENLEFLGNCEIDETYYSFYLPENVDTAIGKGDEYYFSIIQKHPKGCMICIYKQSSENERFYATLDGISDNIQKMLDGFEAYLSEDIDD